MTLTLCFSPHIPLSSQSMCSDALSYPPPFPAVILITGWNILLSLSPFHNSTAPLSGQGLNKAKPKGFCSLVLDLGKGTVQGRASLGRTTPIHRHPELLHGGCLYSFVLAAAEHLTIDEMSLKKQVCKLIKLPLLFNTCQQTLRKQGGKRRSNATPRTGNHLVIIIIVIAISFDFPV